MADGEDQFEIVLAAMTAKYAGKLPEFLRQLDADADRLGGGEAGGADLRFR